MSASDNPRPNIFLHGGWRCGSTYMWSRFRALAGVMAFCEPFSERLASCSAESIPKDHERSWESRHPQLDAPYFWEYAPLISGQGVHLYEDRFAVRRYFVRVEQALDERAYVEQLLEHARSANKQAVLGFCRSLGRARALKHVFGGYHAVLMRDPLQQWLSGRSYRLKYRELYFELNALLILALAEPDSTAGAIARWLRLPRPPEASFEAQLRWLRRRYRRLNDTLSYRAFIAVYILSYLEALPAADLVVDVDLLSYSRRYQQSIAAAFREPARVAPDFSDCSLPLPNKETLPLDIEAIHHEVAERVLNHELENRAPSQSAMISGSFSVIMNKLHSVHRGSIGRRSRSSGAGEPIAASLWMGGSLRRLFGLRDYG